MSTPIRVIKSGTLELTPSNIVLRNWNFNMGDRTGAFETYNFEIMIAVRDYMNARFDAALMMQGDESFGEERLTAAMIMQMLQMPESIPMPKKRRPWWRFWRA